MIVADPPWPMRKIKRTCRPNQTAELAYPTMRLEEIASLRLPLAEDAHVFLWSTQRFLPAALRIVEGWGLKYVALFNWHKPGGFQPVGLPQYNAEPVVYARRGAPRFADTRGFHLCFDGRRGRHSEKPAEFYEMIRKATVGRRIDMYGRRRHEGFDAWGLEVAADREEAGRPG